MWLVNMKIFNKHSLRDVRKELRNNATPQEIILWSYLRNSKLNCKFRRQQSIGPFIVDFYSKEKKLIIEIDGSYHNDPQAKEYDKLRSEYLNSLDLKVLRFWNNEINTNIEGVILKIEGVIGV